MTRALCVDCGSAVPDGQRTCSMCYGDPDHGRDGYYRDWLDRERAQQEAEEHERHEREMGTEATP